MCSFCLIESAVNKFVLFMRFRSTRCPNKCTHINYSKLYPFYVFAYNNSMSFSMLVYFFFSFFSVLILTETVTYMYYINMRIEGDVVVVVEKKRALNDQQPRTNAKGKRNFVFFDNHQPSHHY